jgi:pyruvate/2-oxoglutarate dehydrogenase complex dihydrolipoamide acyltransferase (E2) component
LSGWGIVPVIHGLALIVGSTASKPAVVEGRIEPREILNLTVAIDHDVIDGASATRFALRLVELIESGYGLDEDLIPITIDTGSAAFQAA